MKIRTRLLILLLAIALVPLILNTLFHNFSTLRLSHDLATDSREQLLQNAFNLLNTLVDEYGQILERDEAQILLALHLQAREVNRLLAAPPQPDLPLYFSADFENQETQPEGVQLSTKHFRPAVDGTSQPIPVTYQQQVIFLPRGIKRQTVAKELAQLAPMPETYRLAHDIRPDLFLWQYTALEKGIHSSFPGKGGYPSEYDPRQREWYQAAKSAAQPISRVITDLSTNSLILTMAMPVIYPDGSFAGVTAIDVTYHWLFADWKIPIPWQNVSEAMILLFHDDETSAEKKLEIVYRDQQNNTTRSWQMPVQKQFLLMDNPADSQELFRDLQNGVAGIRKVHFRGDDYLWAYGARKGTRPFPLISLPYELVVAQANRAESYAREQVLNTLRISIPFLVAVVIIVLILAARRSRTVTRPILQLVNAAKNLSEGDFSATVDIRSGDELETLGTAFNAMRISLLEQERMKQSLALAHEIQQHLLPAQPPRVAGFDILGRSLYCDETGGDYYDFIELGDNRMGLAVGDVSGHGISAAMLMTTARGIVRSQSTRQGTDLNGLLTTLNQHLVRDTRDDFFMTFFYALLETDSGKCYWLSAGHGPTFFYSAQDQSVTELPCSGIPLGILDDADFEPMPELQLRPGDILLIGTDGIWETGNSASELFGTDRLRQLIQSHAATSANEICAAIMSAVIEFRGPEPQHDDLTMLIVKAV